VTTVPAEAACLAGSVEPGAVAALDAARPGGWRPVARVYGRVLCVVVAARLTRHGLRRVVAPHRALGIVLGHPLRLANGCSYGKGPEYVHSEVKADRGRARVSNQIHELDARGGASSSQIHALLLLR